MWEWFDQGGEERIYWQLSIKVRLELTAILHIEKQQGYFQNGMKKNFIFLQICNESRWNL
jgi:hypothetical protein